MMRALPVALFLAAGSGFAPPMLLSNHSGHTLIGVRLAPVGTGHWGRNQCENDPDGEVEPGAHLRLAAVGPGRYDVELTDKASRVCLVHNLELKADRPSAAAVTDCFH